MKTHLNPAIRLTGISLVLFCGPYSLSVLGIAQFAPDQGSGKLLSTGGNTYYEYIAQEFRGSEYFHSRPSAVGYNAAGSGGSNKGPDNPAYLEEIQRRIDTFMVYNPTISKSDIPADLITASGSGLDPHISIQAANVQADRIALARGLDPGQIEQVIRQEQEKPLWGLFGPEKVNVLKLNLALDQISTL